MQELSVNSQYPRPTPKWHPALLSVILAQVGLQVEEHLDHEADSGALHNALSTDVESGTFSQASTEHSIS